MFIRLATGFVAGFRSGLTHFNVPALTAVLWNKCKNRNYDSEKTVSTRKHIQHLHWGERLCGWCGQNESLCQNRNKQLIHNTLTAFKTGLHNKEIKFTNLLNCTGKIYTIKCHKLVKILEFLQKKINRNKIKCLRKIWHGCQ